jgi:hypothetical protein
MTGKPEVDCQLSKSAHFTSDLETVTDPGLQTQWQFYRQLATLIPSALSRSVVESACLEGNVKEDAGSKVFICRRFS